MMMHAQGNSPRAASVLRTIVRKVSQGVGLYLSVAVPGRVRTGDEVVDCAAEQPPRGRREQSVATAFNDLRRSTALQRLAAMIQLDVVTQEELSRLARLASKSGRSQPGPSTAAPLSLPGRAMVVPA